MPTLLFFLLPLILLVTMDLPSSYGRGVCSTSCGNLQIIYPLRLRGDPSDCGAKGYELSCENNITVLNLGNSSYYVTDISYTSKFYIAARLLDVKVAHSNCSLPSEIIDSYHFSSPLYLGFHWCWMTFMNCSKEVRDERYQLVPCLGRINSSYIYAINEEWADRIEVLKQNCSFIVKTPTSGSLDANENIFQLLRQGFSVEWEYTSLDSVFSIMLECIPFPSEIYHLYGKDLNPFLYIPAPFHYNYTILFCLLERLEGRPNLSHYLSTVIVAVILGLLLDVAVLIFVICRFVFAPLCLLVFLVYKISMLFVPSDMVERFLKHQEAALTPKRYSYNEIISMTSNFKEKIGQGGFGTVFKGQLPGGYLIAVKMMGKTMGDGEDFINEVSTIGRIHHVNVVQLVGFCVEGPNTRALVYEYMANGSLDKHIFNANNNRSNIFLSIDKLHEIGMSIAKGLNYLHQGCNMRILHFDIKPHNILLDHKFTPKIFDFGLAKLHPKGYSIVSMSAARGTIGYIAPELVSRSFGAISHKSDVYSFGMLLMDMAGRRMHVNVNAENSSQVYYPSWIYDKLLKIEEQNHMVRTEIYETIEIGDVERKLCKVGLWCIQTRPSDRPSMNRVVEMLEVDDINSLQMPPKPFFSASDPAPSINFHMNSFQSELLVTSEE